MPKKYGVKEKDLVVTHVVNLILTGKLRSGDRLDRTEIADELGLSRVPVQEALVQLERDGVVSTRYHRGAFVERFDENAVREHHELYGVLNGIASARAAEHPTAELTDELGGVLDGLRSGPEPKGLQEGAVRFRRAVVDRYAGPRLQAAIIAATTLMPSTFWPVYFDGHGELVDLYEAELAAISGHAPEAARAACVRRAAIMGQTMVAELVRRRVIPPSHFPTVSF
ncbi:GntR family transcriptional regulator [Mycolicibacterium sediminis]|uniref:Putative HTH-type transcriptional regulator n=1 Tax=Mycolicibacterium sediminis TaxID=1286180 RepID=A0A7I7QLD4_9MYCO|nr:GntR family transcriptional regulator [Mycolicibacterium sediminis]BBY27163.1 putative HTH-type transcriptional regulator [Mycolicibacterium sediminis]